MPYLSSLGVKEILQQLCYAKFTCIERLEDVTLIFRKYLSTLLPIILSGDRLQFAMPGPGKNEGQ